ncbi:phage major capsid protein [Phenylobacterium sp. J426]|uniref:phage major capsid protein n=1 Tax=Phenylobacterium sp. J426 TaxID=2898439 RepID=UPI0021510CA8|nr:phage major capsid protein [Phenylobacterium sp. J426]MCR5875162.1 phage major capsid protein [Phenylobacterium sp. J426]
MDLEQLRALLREKLGNLTAIKAKAMAADATDDQVKALEDALNEIEGIEKKIDLAEKAEAAAAKAARPADAPAGEPEGGQRIEPRPEQKMGLDQKLSLTAAAIIKVGKGAPQKAVFDLLDQEGYGSLAKELRVKAPQGFVNTGETTEGGILVPTQLAGGIVPLLRARSTFLGANPTRVQLVNGAFKQGRGATGATASYVGEGGLKPVSTPTFDAIDMKAKKLAGIVPLTNEARKWTVGNIEGYVRGDLQNALSLTMDLAAYLGTGSGANPTGIFNKSGIQTVTGTFTNPKAPTLAELDAFATAMILKLTTANIYSSDTWRWVMSYRTLMYLASMRVGDNDGELAYPTLQGANPTWKGFPVIVTNQVPTNLGTGTDQTLIGLVDFQHVLFGEEEGIVMKVSDQATLDVGGGDLLHLWQQNMFAILAETEHDFGLRYAKAVVKATGIRWGAP